MKFFLFTVTEFVGWFFYFSFEDFFCVEINICFIFNFFNLSYIPVEFSIFFTFNLKLNKIMKWGNKNSNAIQISFIIKKCVRCNKVLSILCFSLEIWNTYVSENRKVVLNSFFQIFFCKYAWRFDFFTKIESHSFSFIFVI